MPGPGLEPNALCAPAGRTICRGAIAFGSGRILLADDHEINRFLAITLLSSAGYSVEVAANGLEALGLARENRFDLILMDVQMPLMDGLDASRAVRASGNEVRQPRIVALTADVLASNREECLLAGIDDFIEKPFDPERFLDTVALNIAALGETCSTSRGSAKVRTPVC